LIVAVKIGMLGSPSVCRAVAAWLADRKPRLVIYDPVLEAGSGGTLSEAGLVEEVRRSLLTALTVFTPNALEAEAFLGRPVTTVAAACEAASALAASPTGSPAPSQGPEWVLVTGGHLDQEDADDVLAGPGGTEVIHGLRTRTARVRGTGCLLSTSIACNLALGMSVPGAVRRAKDTVSEAIRSSREVAKGVRAVSAVTPVGSV